MSFLKSELRYRYLWLEKADHVNAYYINDQDNTYLNRTEGHEMIYFINHIAVKFGWSNYSTALYLKIEKMIKEHCPRENKTHKSVENWLRKNWAKY